MIQCFFRKISLICLVFRFLPGGYSIISSGSEGSSRFKKFIPNKIICTAYTSEKIKKNGRRRRVCLFPFFFGYYFNGFFSKCFCVWGSFWNKSGRKALVR